MFTTYDCRIYSDQPISSICKVPYCRLTLLSNFKAKEDCFQFSRVSIFLAFSGYLNFFLIWIPWNQETVIEIDRRNGKRGITLILGNQCVLLKWIEGSQNNCPLFCGRNSLDVPTQRHKKVPPILLLITLKPIVVRFVFKLLFEPMHNVSFCNFQSGNMEILLQLFGYVKNHNSFNKEI